ncbi:hypothetical protein niasHS_016603 [Heterodera schachtii]|uniref:Rho-GAP domain-containing protein n=1 Tax=Heterodera schachtii TaxID=97005 RepID=A0ABD2HU36_HETSC
MASADQKNTSSATASSAAFASDPPKMGAETIAKPTAPPQKMNTHFLNSSTTPQQTHHRNNSKQPPQQQQQPQTARRNSAARRHTTPDMAASAAYGMVLCGSDEMEQRYRGRIEKVKFGVPVNEAFCPDIPATLLVLLLKVNKEGPLKKDIWRAPGNQAQVRKLSHIMQHGRLVNISNISVYTAASVIKRFLAKLPGGIFGVENERQLFEVAEQHSRAVGTHDDQQIIDLFCRIVTALPVPSQHLLALLFGTFRVITDSAQTFGTRMTPDAIGISVAPSLFHTCIHDGQRAKLEDIMRFKLASQVISKIIQSFGAVRLFPFECYEFYARITGKTLRRDENHWHISFHLPSNTKSSVSSPFIAAAASVAAATASSSTPLITNNNNNNNGTPAAAVVRVASKRSAASRRSLEAAIAASELIAAAAAAALCDSTICGGNGGGPSSAAVGGAGLAAIAKAEEEGCDAVDDVVEEYEAEQCNKRPTYERAISAGVSTSTLGPASLPLFSGFALNGVNNRSRPPPATSEQLRRIEAYCLAANLDVKEQTRLINKQRPSTVATVSSTSSTAI